MSPSSSSPSSYITRLFHSNPVISLHYHHPQMHDPIFWFALLIFSAFLVSFIFTSLSVYKKLSKTKQKGRSQNSDSNYDPTTIARHSVSEVADRVRSPSETDPNQLTHSLLLEVMQSDSSEWAGLFDERGCDGPNREVTDEGQIGKKKKRKAKKKKMNSLAEDEGGGERANSGLRLESVCLYPFTSSSSAMQRKIKQRYDELVKCNESKTLTLPQVVQFANSLVDARNELQHKADAIQRKFVIAKALLFKADRSSFDRLRQQIYKLELEQKRIEEDAFVYNWLQEQLKLSPAYKKMLEIGTCMEKAKSCDVRENEDDEFSDISFEELLAQEKKDLFWQKAAKSRQSSSQ